MIIHKRRGGREEREIERERENRDRDRERETERGGGGGEWEVKQLYMKNNREDYISLRRAPHVISHIKQSRTIFEPGKSNTIVLHYNNPRTDRSNYVRYGQHPVAVMLSGSSSCH